jgi:hypothetical protein
VAFPSKGTAATEATRAKNAQNLILKKKGNKRLTGLSVKQETEEKRLETRDSKECDLNDEATSNATIGNEED